MTLKILIGRFSRNFSRTAEGIELKSGIYVPMNVLLLFAPFENSKWPPAIIIVHWTICNDHYPDLGTFLL